jgi:F420H(2)-dependent quinone reductase
VRLGDGGPGVALLDEQGSCGVEDGLAGGRLGWTMQGVQVGLLTTTGRRSGRTRTVPVVYLDDGSRFLVAASNVGLDAPPAWCLNLRAQPNAELHTRTGSEHVVARELTESERDEAWGRLLEYNPVLGGYQSCTGRQIAVFALERHAVSISRLGASARIGHR